jgi:hypothetical protein
LPQLDRVGGKQYSNFPSRFMIGINHPPETTTILQPNDAQPHHQRRNQICSNRHHHYRRRQLKKMTRVAQQDDQTNSRRPLSHPRSRRSRPDKHIPSPHQGRQRERTPGQRELFPHLPWCGEVRSTPEYPDARASGGDRREGHAREDVVDRNREVSRDTDGETPRKKPLGSQFSSRCAAPALKIPSVSFPPLASHIASCPRHIVLNRHEARHECAH